MKRIVLLILLLFLSDFGNAQAWIDSLRNARDSYKNQEFEKSFFQYTAAQKIAPSSVDLSNETAQVVYRLGKFSIAEKICIRGLKSTTSSYLRSEIFRLMGNAQFRQSNFKLALDSYKTALKLNPDDAVTRYNLACTLKKMRNNSTPEQSPREKEKDAMQRTAQHSRLPNEQHQTSANNTTEKTQPLKENLNTERMSQIKAEIASREKAAQDKMPKLLGAKVIHGQKAEKDW